MAKVANKDFFLKQKIHSKIKLDLFGKTLACALAIAGTQANRNSSESSFHYLDLFAGEGQYVEGDTGSPFIAIEKCINQISNPVNNLNRFRLIFVEKDRDSIQTLQRNITNQYKNSLNENIAIEFIGNEWEDVINDLRNKMSSSEWGFVFADPFSTELNIRSFESAFNSVSELKDYMILFNFQAIKRIMGSSRANYKIIEDCCGIKVEDLDKDENRITQIQESIKRRLHFKKFQIGVAITSSRREELLVSDYFYLVLATSSLGVIDGFLKAYENVINDTRQSLIQRPLPFSPNESNILDTKIIEILKDNPKKITYEELSAELFNTFISWGKSVRLPGYIIPSSKNINKALSRLAIGQKIDIFAPAHLRNRREPNRLKIVKSNHAAREIYIQYRG